MLASAGVAVLLSCPGAIGADDRTKAVSLVNSAIEFYKTHGKEKSFAEIMNRNGRFQDGSLYVFVYDMSGVLVAHPYDVDLIGINVIDSRDPDGRYYVRDRIALGKEKGEGWHEYKFRNPVTGFIEDKTAFVKRHGDYLFGSGTYAKE